MPSPRSSTPTRAANQLTSLSFTQVLMDAGIRISMDGRGRWMDNVFIERLWRSAVAGACSGSSGPENGGVIGTRD